MKDKIVWSSQQMQKKHLAKFNILFMIKTLNRDFRGGTVVKNPPANAGDTGSSPGLGRFHMLQSN